LQEEIVRSKKGCLRKKNSLVRGNKGALKAGAVGGKESAGKKQGKHKDLKQKHKVLSPS